MGHTQHCGRGLKTPSTLYQEGNKVDILIIARIEGDLSKVYMESESGANLIFAYSTYDPEWEARKLRILGHNVRIAKT